MEQEYIDNYFDLFLHPGWKQLIKEMAELDESIRLQDSKNWDGFVENRMKKVMLDRIINFEEYFRIGLENAKEDTDDSL